MAHRKPKVFYWFQVWFDAGPPVMSPGLKFCLPELHFLSDSWMGARWLQPLPIICSHSLYLVRRSKSLFQYSHQKFQHVSLAWIRPCDLMAKGLQHVNQGSLRSHPPPVSEEWHPNWAHGLVRGWGSATEEKQGTVVKEQKMDGRWQKQQMSTLYSSF